MRRGSLWITLGALCALGAGGLTRAANTGLLPTRLAPMRGELSSKIVDGREAPAKRSQAVTAPAGSQRAPAADLRLASLRAMPMGDSASMAAVDSGGADSKTDGAASSVHLHPNEFLGALSKETTIYEQPSLRAKVLGFARTGALLRRAKLPASQEGCKEGWYRVEPNGYVCVGRVATLDLEHPVLKIASFQPDRSLPLPYVYGRSRYPTPPLYTRIPRPDEQAQAEQDLSGHLRKNLGQAWAEEANTPPPSALGEHALIPRPFGYPVLKHEFMTGRALASSAFALIDLFEADGRKWGLTADLSLLPLDRLTKVEASEFSGLVLGPERTLPLVFVLSRSMMLYRRDPESSALVPDRLANFREAFLMQEGMETVGGSKFHVTRDGHYLKDSDRLIWVRTRDKMPKWAQGKRPWIDVSILRQTLVAYEGERPVFVTLVSTGMDGLGDPKTTHSTVQGVFAVHTKHVTATMSGDEVGDEFDLRDVPYVQYFQDGYALHAAFWHDGFGSPRSHGCINLSPADARYLFTWTDPPVPQAWHSALSREGTLVYIHP